jgi:ADP-L-glycero-D-manno-heptose 6-epimerase
MNGKFNGSIIVTGGAGFIGANLIAHILAADTRASIICVDDCRSGAFENLVEACRRAHVPSFTGDLVPDPAADIDWHELLEDIQPSAVFHLAGVDDPSPADDRKALFDAIEGFRGVLYACVDQGVPLVYASSHEVYGLAGAQDRKPLPEDAGGEPVSLTGFAKRVMENVHTQLLSDRDPGDPPAHVVALRMFSVFGPGESRCGTRASFVRRAAERIAKGERPKAQHAGAAADMVHVHDAVACLLAAAAPKVRSGVYNCGSGVATPLQDAVDAVCEALGVQPRDFAIDAEPPPSPRAAQPAYACADLTRATRHLRWTPAQEPRRAIIDYAAHLKAELGR